MSYPLSDTTKVLREELEDFLNNFSFDKNADYKRFIHGLKEVRGRYMKSLCRRPGQNNWAKVASAALSRRKCRHEEIQQVLRACRR